MQAKSTTERQDGNDVKLTDTNPELDSQLLIFHGDEKYSKCNSFFNAARNKVAIELDHIEFR